MLLSLTISIFLTRQITASQHRLLQSCDSVLCKTNPCDTATCPAFPQATCNGDCCTGQIFTNCREDVTAQCGDPSCRLPMEIGCCRAALNRYWYNERTETCELFSYGGCGGNANNFETKVECALGSSECCNTQCFVDPCEVDQCPNFPEATCRGDCCTGAIFFNGNAEVTDQCGVDTCTLLPEVGPCEALFTRYYYDGSTKSCQAFTYGGCQGNGNNFDTQQECEAACPDCSLPADAGPCDAVMDRYYFDSELNRCQSFTYGGCQGNSNNFESRPECNQACRRP